MIYYIRKRMLRDPMPGIATILIAFAFTLLLARLTITINTQKQQLESMYDNMHVNCVFADPKGKTEGIYITNTLIDVCMTENYKLSQYIEEPLFKRSLNYRTENGDALLVGLNSSSLEDSLKDLPDRIFQGNDDTIVVNENSGYKIGDAVNLIVRLGNAYEEVEFTVVGVYRGESTSFYCPWNVICELALRLGGEISAESGRFTLADNRKLTEFKNVAKEYFDQVDVSGDGRGTVLGMSLIIHDSEFCTTTSAATRNIMMLELLIPLFYITALGVSFLVSFLLTRNRYMELSLMRRIGARPSVIIGLTLLEQFLAALLGVVCGMILVRDFKTILLFLCFTAGSLVSSLLVFRKSIMRTRSE